ncbi:uncharacterized protein J3D65DRAFT_604217 [Phyllosticta citribraziliensis]|uniref:Uncharacterized protein n=1 Tax=Phyllosticta citribraziliensis TaxID=989973 RepID=A0ABR1LHR5_9PEZI
MAPRTRKRNSDPEDSVRPTPRHAKASPTRPRSARAPRSNAARYRQSTLTQIVPEVSFLSRGSAAEESEDEEHAPRPVKRRRRRIGPSQKTLTQIGWINPLVVPSDDEEQEEEGEGDGEEGFESEVLPSDDDEYDEVVAGEQNENEDTEEVFYGFSDNEENHEGDKLHGANSDGVKDSPQTPRRPRPREIPSSQTPPVTPLTPLSVLRKRGLYNGRSPLKMLSTNGNQDNKSRDRAKMPPPKFPTPVKRRGVRVAFETNVVKVAPKLLSERSHISDSQDLSDEEGFGVASPRGIAIGQETQAMIHQIDAACGLDSPGQTTPSKNRATPEAASESPSTSQASRSFNFDEDEAGVVASPAPAKKSPILGEDVQEENTRAGDNQEQDVEDENAEQEDEDEEFSTSSFPTPRAPPPTQATPTHTPTQESRTSQPFALQHPSQVSTVAETTQATPARATSVQREKSRSQKLGRARHQTARSSEDVKSTSHRTVIPSQASTTDDPIESQTPKAQFQHRSQQRQDDRIPESPLASSNSKTNATHARNPRPRSRKTRSSPSQAASSSTPRPPPALLLTSSPTSPSLSTSNRHANTENIPATRQRLELYSSGVGGGGNAGASFDGKVISATQMLPESLMNYSMPLPPAGWDASSVGWVASSMPDEEDEGEGEN